MQQELHTDACNPAPAQLVPCRRPPRTHTAPAPCSAASPAGTSTTRSTPPTSGLHGCSTATGPSGRRTHGERPAEPTAGAPMVVVSVIFGWRRWPGASQPGPFNPSVRKSEATGRAACQLGALAPSSAVACRVAGLRPGKRRPSARWNSSAARGARPARRPACPATRTLTAAKLRPAMY
jgi:hypothetical protein